MIRKLFVLAALASLTSGCAMSMATPVTGFIYTGDQGTVAVTSNPIGAKRGEACAMSILGAVGIGDASAVAAAKAGGITKIATVDSDNFGILGVYAKNCTIVTGE